LSLKIDTFLCATDDTTTDDDHHHHQHRRRRPTTDDDVQWCSEPRPAKRMAGVSWEEMVEAGGWMSLSWRKGDFVRGSLLSLEENNDDDETDDNNFERRTH
jgi:hypothetical protein